MQARIAAVRQRTAEQHQRRQELAEARQHGIAARHAQRLANQARRPLADDERTGPVGYLAACLAVLRTGRSLDGASVILAAVVPSPDDVAEARRIAEGLTALAQTPAVDRRPANPADEGATP
ncbi:hypothetical protein SHJG_5478 [Streptomyces hygroscopicus subsp. jinggangensis 5008]|nr:hypothetical protein SHJG_5478 [Streptomyces hygroscopicus subsp. jinggangensis 5008]AGF64904.1 hypothetical protein SHJGH_5241 [Streptomyces hygroscopicus subsp. jinggangensis TL01]